LAKMGAEAGHLAGIAALTAVRFFEVVFLHK
jgi:hypothetical protein